MTLTDWRDNLDTLGPDLTVWPTNLIPGALDLLAASEEARALFVSATAVALSEEERRHGAPSFGALVAANS